MGQAFVAQQRLCNAQARQLTASYLELHQADGYEGCSTMQFGCVDSISESTPMVESTMQGGSKAMSMGYGSQLPPSSFCALNFTTSGMGQPLANVEVCVKGACARSSRFSSSSPCSTGTSSMSSACTCNHKAQLNPNLKILQAACAWLTVFCQGPDMQLTRMTAAPHMGEAFCPFSNL